MLKILQDNLQQYMNQELPDVQAGCRKVRGTKDQIAICWIIRKQGNSRKTSASLTTLKPLTVWITTNCGKFWEIGITDHITCLLRNWYSGQEATVRKRHGTMNWFKTGNGVCQGCILLPCLFNLHAEYLTRNARLDEAKLESRLPVEISTTSYMQMLPL